MIARFMDLEPEKRERIINAALEEFALKGYKNASTNEIVKKAGIAKGLLFHYFKNKKGLFLFLYDYALDVILNDFYSKIHIEGTDVIERIRQIVLLKIELYQRYPDLNNFLMNSLLEDDVEIKSELDSRLKDITSDGFHKLFEGIDTRNLREGMDIGRVLDIIVWVSQGFNNRELDRMKQDSAYKANFDVKAIMAEFDGYFSLLKNAFFK